MVIFHSYVSLPKGSYVCDIALFLGSNGFFFGGALQTFQITLMVVMPGRFATIPTWMGHPGWYATWFPFLNDAECPTIGWPNHAILDLCFLGGLPRGSVTWLPSCNPRKLAKDSPSLQWNIVNKWIPSQSDFPPSPVENVRLGVVWPVWPGSTPPVCSPLFVGKTTLFAAKSPLVDGQVNNYDLMVRSWFIDSSPFIAAWPQVIYSDRFGKQQCLDHFPSDTLFSPYLCWFAGG